MKWFAQAPANIALIKYMGKLDADENIPTNPSLSYTLPNLTSYVELEDFAGHKDSWEPLDIPGAFTFSLTEAAQQRYIEHLNYIKHHFLFKGSFIIRSCNNFPLASGLASSASSFAALTKCAINAICELTHQPQPPIEFIANLSRHGSGSSCRSFFSPWALWDDEQVGAIDLPYAELIHQVILISHDVKAVSSSQAHRQVKSSPLFNDRPQRAQQNLQALITALQSKKWRTAYEICWQEFSDLHELFESAIPPFSYRTAACYELLDLLQKNWQTIGDGPIVTMDAGPNIHLLYRPDQIELAEHFKRHYLLNNYDVL